MKDVLVSVIVPVYKVENYIRRCIESIIDQTYGNLEVILVDDGSPDGCGAICDEYAGRDVRIKVLHQENRGLSGARNAALDIARGDFILCVDSDDHIHERMVEKLLAAAGEYEADIVICSHFAETSKQLSIRDRIIDDVLVMDRMDAIGRLVDDEEIKSYAWGKLYKRELFDGVRYPVGRNYEDMATTYYLFDKASKIVRLPEYLYYYTVRDDSISYNNSTASWHKGCHASCLGQEERAAYFKEKGYDELYKKAMAVLLPYIYSDIKSAYRAGAPADARDAKKYLLEYKGVFLDNDLVSAKDKKLIDIYLKGQRSFELYNKVKGRVKKVKTALFPDKKAFDFTLAEGKNRRIIYFELPCFDNLGDHAIAYATCEVLEKIAKETGNMQLFVIPGWKTVTAISLLKRQIGKDDVIVCQGGGNFGSLYEFASVYRRKVLKAFWQNKIVIMPQTVYYEDDEKGQKELEKDKAAIKRCRDITVLAREEKSFELFGKYFGDCGLAGRYLVHDIVSRLEVQSEECDRNGIILCLRSDKESNLTAGQKSRLMEETEKTGLPVRITDTCINHEISDSEREKTLFSKLKLFSEAELVLTDRLHGMLFSLITRTPCIVLGNNHHKVYGTFRTISDCGYIKYAADIDEALKLLPKMINPGCREIERPDYFEDYKLYYKILECLHPKSNILK